MTYRRGRAEVKAFEYNGNLFDSMLHGGEFWWAFEAYMAGTLYYSAGELYIVTPEGDQHIDDGDYIIQFSHEGIGVASPQLFTKTFNARK